MKYFEQFIFGSLPGRPSSHCAALTALPDALFCVWYAGSAEAADDVAVMSACYDIGAGSWADPAVLVDTRGKGDGNTIAHFDDESDRLWLFHTVLQDGGWSSVLLYSRYSDDLGQTWSQSQLFDEEPGMMVRTGMVELASGRWVLPAYDEKSWDSFCYLSDNLGKTWMKGALMPSDAPLIQPAIVQLEDGHLLAYMRSGGQERCVWQSMSGDDGETWEICTATELRNPDSGLDMLRAQSGTLVLIFNNTAEGRSPLHVGLSDDHGMTWPVIEPLETGPGEYSYPSMLQSSDGLIHAVYTYRRQTIKHVAFDLEYVRTQK
ncbi:MAG: exo-alpha-sialidase [Armatimonadetes bacterium]|nr:exo-alpha-sialidase [Armatimonadota bacterium]